MCTETFCLANSTCDSSSNPLSGPYSFQNPPCSLESRVNGVNGAQEETSSSLKATPPRKRSLMDTIAKLSGSAAKNKVQVCGP